MNVAKYAEDKEVVLRTAFSRDQAKKVYVQDLLREDSTMIWDLLQVILVLIVYLI